MAHLVPVAHPSDLDIARVRLIVVIIGSLLHGMMILGARGARLKAALGVELSLLLLLLGLVADLNIGEVVLVVSVDCAGHAIRGNPLLDASLVSTNELVLGSVVLIVLIQRVSTNLDFSSINGNLWPMRAPTTLLGFRLLGFKLRRIC